MPLIDGRHTCRCANHLRRDGDGFHSKRAPVHYPPDLSLEPVHRDIALTLDIEKRSAAGSVTTTVVARRHGPRSLVLDAVDFEEVSVEDAQGQALSFTYDGDKLRVQWDEPFEDGETRKLVVRYRVHEPVSGLFFSHPSEEHPELGTWAATDHETERARHWLPCIDHPNVRTTLAFHLRARADYTILANGRKTGEEAHDDGTKTVHWELDFPCPSYLVCFALGDFSVAEDGEFEGIPLAYFASREHPSENLMRSFGRTRDMLAWMTQKLDAEFPFPKYYQFALPGIGGAMENISLVSWDDIFVLDEKLAEEWSWLVDQINVHEMAHSYFGDAIVARDYAHVWLKESWATYMEQCWLEDRYGDDEKHYDFYRNAQAYFEEADGKYKRPMVTRTFDTSWDMFDRHLYPGGACRLHTLRNVVGDEVFWEAVRDYVATYSGRVVETDDFRRVMEKHSGRSLVQFFEQWFYTAGYPDLKVSFAYDAEASQGTFTIEQKQVGEDESGPCFTLDLELAWTIEGERKIETVRLERPRQSFVVAMEHDPAMVRVDPNGKVLCKLEFNPGDDKLRTQLTESPDVLGRIYAAHELAKTGRRQNIRAIAEAYQHERFWGVRQQFVKALASAATAASLDALVHISRTELDPMVLESVFREAGKFRDRRLAKAALARLDDAPPYRAARAAYELLGANPATKLEWLVEASAESTYHAIAQGGALHALARTRRAEVAEVLMARARPGATSLRARMEAASALGELGRFLEKRERAEVSEFLQDLLRDPDIHVATRAAGALRTMMAREAIGALEAFQARLPAQDQVGVRRMIDALRKGEDDKIKNLEQELEDVRERYRKLEERLEKLEAQQPRE